jgi:hypothetical protein
MRMMLIAGLPIALLAGATTQALLQSQAVPDLLPRWQWARRTFPAMLGLAGLLFLLKLGFLRLSKLPIQLSIYWLLLCVWLPILVWLLLRARSRDLGQWAWVWFLVLLGDLWALALPLVQVRPAEDLLTPSAAVEYLAAHADEPGRVLDYDLGGYSCNSPLGPSFPLLLGIESARGYNPLNLHRYREYMQFIADEDEPLPSLEVVPNLPIKNKSLLDLLGVRYLLLPAQSRDHYVVRPSAPESMVPAVPLEIANPPWREVLVDRQPVAYAFARGGIRQFPPYAVYENLEVLPRAMVVFEAAPLPERAQVLESLKHNDFRTTVLLPSASIDTPLDAGTEQTRAGQVRIEQLAPNRVDLRVQSSRPAYVVLNDVWVPGWRATVRSGGGEQVEEVLRANFLFRAVRIPAGTSEVSLEYAPRSIAWGQGISIFALGLVTIGCALGIWARRHRHRLNSQAVGVARPESA